MSLLQKPEGTDGEGEMAVAGIVVELSAAAALESKAAEAACGSNATGESLTESFAFVSSDGSVVETCAVRRSFAEADWAKAGRAATTATASKLSVGIRKFINLAPPLNWWARSKSRRLFMRKA